MRRLQPTIIKHKKLRGGHTAARRGISTKYTHTSRVRYDGRAPGTGPDPATPQQAEEAAVHDSTKYKGTGPQQTTVGSAGPTYEKT